MERPGYGNASVVSRYWTAAHLDVTDVPLAYAPPKASWIDGFYRLRPLVKIDSGDRMARLRQQTHSIVKPEEIPRLPPLALPDALPRSERRLQLAAWWGQTSVARALSIRRAT